MSKTGRTGMALSLAAAMAVWLLAGCGVQKKEEVHLTVKVPALTLVSVCDPEIESAEELFEKAADAYTALHLARRRRMRRLPAASTSGTPLTCSTRGISTWRPISTPAGSYRWMTL